MASEPEAIQELEAECDRLRTELEATRDELELTRYRETKLKTAIAEIGERSRILEKQRNDLHARLEYEMLQSDARMQLEARHNAG